MTMHHQFRRAATIVLLMSIVAGALTILSCGSTGTTTRAKMGEKIQLDGVSYTVLGAEWLASLGSPAEARVPQHQFLVIRIALDKESGEAREMASMKLIAPDGTEYEELANGTGLADWFGIVRTLDTSANRQGSVLFDAPRGVYQLKLTAAAIDEDEADSVLIEIPVRMEPMETPSSMDIGQ